MSDFRHFQNSGFRGNNQNTNTYVCILEMTLINSLNKKLSSIMKSPEKIVLLETVKLNTHEICKLLQLKQSAKFSPCEKGLHGVFQRSNS